MNDDGTPETDLEEWLLEAGLGFSYAMHGEAELTKAQAERLAESTPEPETNPLHDWLARELVSHYE